jgi:hypothetical protein
MVGVSSYGFFCQRNTRNSVCPPGMRNKGSFYLKPFVCLACLVGPLFVFLVGACIDPMLGKDHGHVPCASPV